MGQNPYLKDEQEFRPLLMRGSFGNKFLTTSEQARQELSLASAIPKKTYDLNGVSFDMVRPPLWEPDGTMPPIRNVEMCTTECTQELFEAVMGFNYARFKDQYDAVKRPIETVSWFECILFCNKLSEMLGYKLYYEISDVERELDDTTITGARVNIIGGNGFRLPTETEWLIFARAGTENEWSGTNNEKELGDYAWYKGNANGKTHPVATKKPNEWGMYDMTGNVEEWVWDKWDIRDVSPSASRVYRGGSWPKFHASNLRSAYRLKCSPSRRYDVLGFRFARTIE